MSQQATPEAAAMGYKAFKGLCRNAGLTLGGVPPTFKFKRTLVGDWFDRINLVLSVRDLPNIHAHTFNSYKQQFRAGNLDYVAVNRHSYGIEHGPVVDVGELMEDV